MHDNRKARSVRLWIVFADYRFPPGRYHMSGLRLRFEEGRGSRLGRVLPFVFGRDRGCVDDDGM